MPKDRSDKMTIDLLTWEPPTLVSRFEETALRTSCLKSRIARAVATTLRDSEEERDNIAAAMSRWLGEEVPKNMLDAYASEAREDHTISFLRLLALIQVTKDDRLLQLGAELFGLSVIDDKYLPWVEVGQLADKKEDLDRAYDYARRAAKRGAKS